MKVMHYRLATYKYSSPREVDRLPSCVPSVVDECGVGYRGPWVAFKGLGISAVKGARSVWRDGGSGKRVHCGEDVIYISTIHCCQ